MRKSTVILTIFVFLSLCLSGCSKISLGGAKGGAGQGQIGGHAAPQGPVIDGRWNVSFEVGEQSKESQIDFAQSGDQLAGQGTDQETGAAFYLERGQLAGGKVRFVKKYSAADPGSPTVEYDGTLSFKNIPEYQGWIMEGHYTTRDKSNATLEGKWIATPETPLPPPPSSQPPAQPQAQAPAPQAQPQPGQPEPAAQSSEGAPHLSGLYLGSYEFNFKKINFKMWLEQDGEHVGGHGIDTNTNERFVISKGWYAYPKLTIIRHYDKGKNAAATRDITFKGQVGSGPSFKGDTQYGGDWDAHIVR